MLNKLSLLLTVAIVSSGYILFAEENSISPCVKDFSKSVETQINFTNEFNDDFNIDENVDFHIDPDMIQLDYQEKKPEEYDPK
jgi:hypothetical protein